MTRRDGDLRHLREQGLIETVRLDGRRDVAVVLTERGRDLLDANRDRDPRQEFYAGLTRERELEHDAQRGAHGAAAARSGFSCYRGSSARIGGRSGGGQGGGGRNGGFAEEFWD